MTDPEIIEKLATEFMDWHTGACGNGEADFHWEDADGNHVAKFSTIPWGEENPELTWNPLVDPAACALVLDEIERRGWGWKWDRWHGEHIELAYCFTLILPDREIWEYSDTRYRAVCLAVLGAMGE